MHIELTDLLRCPAGHEESFLVLLPEAMDGRRVMRGVLGCPACNAAYRITDGVAEFGAPPTPPAGAAAPLGAEALGAFLDLQGRGGVVVLVGEAAAHAATYAALAEGVHVAAVNPPAGVTGSSQVSVLRTTAALPLKSRHVRGVALGADAASEPWLGEAIRVLLPGLRLVVADESVHPAGARELARGGGAFVGERM